SWATGPPGPARRTFLDAPRRGPYSAGHVGRNARQEDADPGARADPPHDRPDGARDPRAPQGLARPGFRGDPDPGGPPGHPPAGPPLGPSPEALPGRDPGHHPVPGRPVLSRPPAAAEEDRDRLRRQRPGRRPLRRCALYGPDGPGGAGRPDRPGTAAGG